MMIATPRMGELVFLQATPFCNIDCDYCYLQERDDKSRMSFDTLRRVLEFVRQVGTSNASYCLIWHIGEPLVVPADWYRRAHELCSEILDDRPLEFHFQTNATLLTFAWTRFFQSDPRIRLGVSLDGPRELHDRHRKTRKGGPTHDRAMRGVALLKEAALAFDCIAVVTESTLDHPDDFYDFFVEVGPRMLSINAENIDGHNRGSSLSLFEGEARYRRFLRRVADLHLRERSFIIRNFIWAQLHLKAVAEGRLDDASLDGNRLNRPWRTLSFDWRGRLHTFSPSLLGEDLPGIGPALGSVWKHDYLTVSRSECVNALTDQIERGVEHCRQSCALFAHCGGGSPAHKWFEHRAFDVSETAECRLGVQSNWETYLDAVEELLIRGDSVP